MIIYYYNKSKEFPIYSIAHIVNLNLALLSYYLKKIHIKNKHSKENY